jgi:hypothetical protein
LRTELLGKDFPASAAITVQGFAQPEMMLEAGDCGDGIEAERGWSSRGRAWCCLGLGRFTRKYFRTCSPSVAASGCLQTLQCSGTSLARGSAFARTTL